jgi:hypothetical protein
MINTTSAPRRPVDAVIPVYGVNIRVPIPRGGFKGIEVLRGEGVDVEVRRAGRLADGAATVELLVPELKEYLALRIATK